MIRTVLKISSKVGKEFIKEHHYSHGCHNGPTCYGLFEEKKLVGVLAFATPCSENVRGSIFGSSHVDKVTELHRLVLFDYCPKNSESWFISRCLKLLKKDKPRICAVISFADTTEGHLGIIYQATNFLYYGMSSKAKFYIDGDGRLRHPRQCGVNIKKDEATRRGWKSTYREAKHRYVILLPDSKKQKKELISMLKIDISPYPKCDQ